MNIDDIFFVPLDIPFLQFKHKKEIVDIFLTEKTSINKPTDSSIPEFWEGILCFKKLGVDESTLLYPGKHVDLSHLINEEIEILNNHLPLEVETISLWSNKIYVPAHVDKKVYDQEKDFRFRFVLVQEHPSFFINYKTDCKYIQMPSETNVFAFNNYNCKHGATVPKGEKILGIIRGKITNYTQFVDLINRSSEKYKSLVIDKTKFI